MKHKIHFLKVNYEGIVLTEHLYPTQPHLLLLHLTLHRAQL